MDTCMNIIAYMYIVHFPGESVVCMSYCHALATENYTFVFYSIKSSTRTACLPVSTV